MSAHALPALLDARARFNSLQSVLIDGSFHVAESLSLVMTDRP